MEFIVNNFAADNIYVYGTCRNTDFKTQSDLQMRDPRIVFTVPMDALATSDAELWTQTPIVG